MAFGVSVFKFQILFDDLILSVSFALFRRKETDEIEEIDIEIV